MVLRARAEPVLVPFRAGRPATGPLTCGQLSTIDWLAGVTESIDADLDQPLEVPAGAGLKDVSAALEILLVRHEGLRTRYVPARCTPDQLRAGQRPDQVTIPAGTLAVDRYPVEAGADPGTITTALRDRLRDDPVRSTPALPVRFAVATVADTVVAAVVSCSHLAVDYHALQFIGREFTALVADPAARADHPPPHQPLDRAAVERSPRLARRAEATMRYLAERLERMPQCLYARPRVTDPAARHGEAMAVMLASPAGTLALRTIAARTRLTRSAIVLAAVAKLLAHRSGYPVCEFPVMAGNRHERDLTDYVGVVAQTTLITIEVGTASFDALVGRAFAATVAASRAGCYDVYRRMDLTDRIEWDRGVSFNFGPVFNNLVITNRPDPPVSLAQIAAAPAATLDWAPMPPSTPVLRFDLWSFQRLLRLRLYSGDAGRADRAEVEALLLAVERLIVAAAAGDLDDERMREIIGLPPIDRGPGWVQVDSCWVELDEVRRLVTDALDPLAVQVFADDAGQPMVAYVAGGTARTAVDAHARCMAALPGRVTAMAPRRYVLCDRAPDRPADLAAWRRIPVLAEGTGRIRYRAADPAPVA